MKKFLKRNHFYLICSGLGCIVLMNVLSPIAPVVGLCTGVFGVGLSIAALIGQQL